MATDDLNRQIHMEHARAAMRDGRFAEAVAHYRAVWGLTPSFEAAQNSAIALSRIGRVEEALRLSRSLLSSQPERAIAWYNHAFILSRRDGDPEEALAALDRACELQPDFHNAHLAKATFLLEAGRYRDGFALHERRWEDPRRKPGLRIFSAPWAGEPLAGKTLLLHSERHFGTTILLARYARMAVAAGAEVVMEVERSLQRLLAGSGLGTVVARGESLPPFDVHCPFSALPQLFATTLDTVPCEFPYLQVPQPQAGRRLPVPVGGGAIIAFAFRGASRHKRDRDDERGLPLQLLLELIARWPECRWVSLQVDATEAERAQMLALPNVIDASLLISDWADTAALVAEADLVISVDTALAHLAGALGVPLWLMAPFELAWPWRCFGRGPAWYPQARVWRQPKPGDWRAVIEGMGAARQGS